jgi:hypothetical protein
VEKAKEEEKQYWIKEDNPEATEPVNPKDLTEEAQAMQDIFKEAEGEEDDEYVNNAHPSSSFLSSAVRSASLLPPHIAATIFVFLTPFINPF